MGDAEWLGAETISLRQNRISAILPSIQPTLVGCWKGEKKTAGMREFPTTRQASRRQEEIFLFEPAVTR
jgi:hypothetical protein